jgi:hypothetical protein
MDYYKSKLLASNEIDKIFNKCKDKKISFRINEIILNITSRFGVGEKFVQRRIELLADAPGIKINNGDVEFE